MSRLNSRIGVVGVNWPCSRIGYEAYFCRDLSLQLLIPIDVISYVMLLVMFRGLLVSVFVCLSWFLLAPSLNKFR